jgi:hypothetical protein
VTPQDPYQRAQRAGLDHLMMIAIEQATAREENPASRTLPLPRAAWNGDQLAQLAAEIASPDQGRNRSIRFLPPVPLHRKRRLGPLKER